MKKSIVLFLMVFGMGNCVGLDELYQAAKEGQANAYCPYSNYHVGAALLTKSGKVYTGCNVENASWSVSICSERTAIVKAISEGEREFERIAIVTKDGGMSCGMCRQMLNEFSPDIEIVTFDESGNVVVQECLRDMLPRAFGPESLTDIPQA